jgi:nicotinamide-nucleotide amidase
MSNCDGTTLAKLREARRSADIAHGRLVELGRTVCVAESLTGGIISAVLTEAPGTSVTFRGGLVVYCTDLKHKISGVRNEDLEQYGPVHSVIAEQLALGARQRMDADFGIGVTGVAGPGEQDGRPVGEVFIAVSSESHVLAKRYQFAGSRMEIRIATAAATLSDFVSFLEGKARESG